MERTGCRATKIFTATLFAAGVLAMSAVDADARNKKSGSGAQAPGRQGGHMTVLEKKDKQGRVIKPKCTGNVVFGSNCRGPNYAR